MLMLAARAQHVSERIAPVLETGRDVVVDRYSASTLA
jgi:thymidylate kinase